jgi:type II secretory pathway pseudopilin PulG
MDQLRSLGRNELLIGGGVIAVLLIIAFALLSGDSGQAERDEVIKNVNAIRTAEIEYHSAFGQYISAEAAPRKPHSVDAQAIAWQPSEGFKTLSWAPAQETVYGTYWVTADKNGFTVHGACDTDGDGVRATIEATLEAEAKLTSAASVY